VQLSFCTYFLLYPLVITLQDWSVNYVRKLKCQPCMEAAHFLENPSSQYKVQGLLLWSSSAASSVCKIAFPVQNI
ncbi:MAG: hypothetical protein WAK17_28500, partial [Candidatus Nitrosopolaris sp.]